MVIWGQVRGSASALGSLFPIQLRPGSSEREMSLDLSRESQRVEHEKPLTITRSHSGHLAQRHPTAYAVITAFGFVCALGYGEFKCRLLKTGLRNVIAVVGRTFSCRYGNLRLN